MDRDELDRRIDRVQEWLDGGCNSWGLPQQDIQNIVEYARLQPSGDGEKMRDALNDAAATLLAVRATAGSDEWAESGDHFSKLCLETVVRINACLVASPPPAKAEPSYKDGYAKALEEVIPDRIEIYRILAKADGRSRKAYLEVLDAHFAPIRDAIRALAGKDAS